MYNMKRVIALLLTLVMLLGLVPTALAAEAAAPDGTGDSWNTSSRHSSSAASFCLIMSSLPQKLPWKIVFYHISGFFVKSHPMAAVV